MSQTERKYYQTYIKFLVDNKIVHSIRYTGRTFKVKSGIGNCEFINSLFSFKALGFMAKVRAHITNEETYKAVRQGEFKRLKLINMAGVDKGSNRFDKYTEFDLDKAYWTGALKAGAIDEDLYNEGIELGLTKIELLASIGAMAKTERSRYFDGTKYRRSVILNDSAATRHIWNAVSWQVDKCMQECARELGREQFLFYWTDAVFFRDTAKNRSRVNAVVKRHGFTCKQVRLEYLSKNKDGQMVAWTKQMKGHAQEEQVLRDEFGNYGRVFVYVNNKKTMMQEINDMVEKMKHGK